MVTTVAMVTIQMYYLTTQGRIIVSVYCGEFCKEMEKAFLNVYVVTVKPQPL